MKELNRRARVLSTENINLSSENEKLSEDKQKLKKQVERLEKELEECSQRARALLAGSFLEEGRKESS